MEDFAAVDPFPVARLDEGVGEQGGGIDPAEPGDGPQRLLVAVDDVLEAQVEIDAECPQRGAVARREPSDEADRSLTEGGDPTLRYTSGSVR